MEKQKTQRRNYYFLLVSCISSESVAEKSQILHYCELDSK